jgi:hypothetical protein
VILARHDDYITYNFKIFDWRMILNSVIFEDCYNSYKNDFGDGRTWNDLAVLYGYPSGENLRSAVKRERKRRGLP